MSITAAQDRWEVLLSTPADIGDFGLHQEEDVAAAHFRRQLLAELGDEHAAAVGPEAEQQFRRSRRIFEGEPVLWSGFVMLATPAGAGREDIPGEDSEGWPQDPEEAAELRELARTPRALLISLSVAVTEFVPPPGDSPLTPAAMLRSGLRARYGEQAGVHLVSYGEINGVASVRSTEADVAGSSHGGMSFASDSPPAHQMMAEVSLVFPEDEALVTVTAGTTDSDEINQAVLLAGSIAGTVRLRSLGPDGRPVARPAQPPPAPATALSGANDQAPAAAGAQAPATQAAEPATPAAGPGPLQVALPDGQVLPPGTALLGRAPRRTAEHDTDHLITLRDESISRTHLLLRVEDGRVWATDLGSRNGTLRQRPGAPPERLAANVATELAAGDLVNIGAAILTVTD